MVKKILRITLKVFLWIFICVFAIILVAVIALQFPQTQKFLTGKAVTFLENKIKTRVELGGINVAFPKSVVLEDIYLEDQKKDTLLYAHKIDVDIDLLGLINNKVEVNNIELENITGHVQRTLPDSAFNFDYIIEAFASDSAKEEKVEDTTKSNMEIKLMGLELTNIYVTFQDEVTGTDALVKLGEFELEMDKFDLDKMEFVVDFIELHNTKASLVQSKLPTSTQDPESQPLDVHFDLGKLDLSNIDLVYDNQVNKQKIDLNLGELVLEPNKIDLVKQNIDLDELELNNTSIVYTQGKSVVKDTLVHEKVAKKVGDEMEQESKESGRPWTVTLDQLKMVANSLKFDDFNSPALQEGIDFKHMKVDGLGMDIENIAYSGLEVAADINKFVFREKSGFRINDFEAKVRMDSTSAKLTDLNLKTNKTHLKDHLEIRFASLSSIGDNIGDLGLNVNLDHCLVAFEDILYFQPALAKNPPFAGNETNTIELTGRLEGKVSDLSIPNFELLALNSTVLQASGRIKGLPDMEKAFIDMKVSKLASTSKDIYDLLPKNTIPASISLPGNINVNADFKGYLNNFDANAIVKTSFGGMTAKMNMDPPKNGKEVYKASVRINNFLVNKLLKNDSLYGPVSLRADIDGQGFSPENMVATLDASIQKAVFKGYPYQNLDID
jgi:translocation and assembly module TamB